MTRTVRINRDRPWAFLMEREYSSPDVCANGTDGLADTVLRLSDQP